MSWIVLTYLVISCFILSYLILSCLEFSCFVFSRIIMSCPILSCPVLSCLVLSYPVLSYPVLPCLVLSYAVLSYPNLSCPIMSSLSCFGNFRVIHTSLRNSNFRPYCSLIGPVFAHPSSIMSERKSSSSSYLVYLEAMRTTKARVVQYSTVQDSTVQYSTVLPYSTA